MDPKPSFCRFPLGTLLGRGSLGRSALTFLLCTAGWVAAAPPIHAQEERGGSGFQVGSAPIGAMHSQEPRLQDPDRRRLLTLGSGEILRVRSRRTAEGIWQVRDHRGWRDLSVEVRRARLLRDVQAQAEALRRDLPDRDPRHREELARWMIAAGLYPEAVAELDRILAETKDTAGVRALLAQERVPIELSSQARGNPALALEETLLAGAGASPAWREVAVQALRDYMGRLDLRAVLERELTAPSHHRRAFAAFALGRLYSSLTDRALGRALGRALVRRGLLDSWSDVRGSAAAALRDEGDVGVLLPVISGLENPNGAVRANAAEMLGNLGFEAAVEPLMLHLSRRASSLGGGSGANTGTRANLFAGLQTAYVMDYDLEIAQAASVADPIVAVQASGVSFDVRTTVQMTEVVELRRTMTALRQLTGQRLGNDPRAWLEWWRAHGKEWRALDRARAYEERRSVGTPPASR